MLYFVRTVWGYLGALLCHFIDAKKGWKLKVIHVPSININATLLYPQSTYHALKNGSQICNEHLYITVDNASASHVWCVKMRRQNDYGTGVP